jgi:hypothetical protein
MDSLLEEASVPLDNSFPFRVVIRQTGPRAPKLPTEMPAEVTSLTVRSGPQQVILGLSKPILISIPLNDRHIVFSHREIVYRSSDKAWYAIYCDAVGSEFPVKLEVTIVR